MVSIRKMVIIALLATVSYAAQWQSTQVELHRGYNYNAPVDIKYDASVLSFTHSNGWRFGDNLFWFDATRLDEGFSDSTGMSTVSIYGEYSPRVSIFKIAGADRSEKLLGDLSVAGNFEFAPSDFNYLFGLGTSFNVPGFSYLNVNAYVRNTPDFEGVTFQLTSSWAIPIKLGAAEFLFDGFFDFAGEEGDDKTFDYSAMNFHTQSALLFDVGSIFKKTGNLYLGSEFVYWNNKYGIKDFDEIVPQITFRWVF